MTVDRKKILPIKISVTHDYREQKMEHFWLKNTPNEIKEKEGGANSKKLCVALQNCRQSIICIQSENITDKELLNAIFAATKHNRIYILTNQKNEALQSLTGCCLIRYGIKNLGSFIIINANAIKQTGFLFPGQLTSPNLENNPILLDLDKEQIDTLFRFFTYHFWNTATHEIIDDFKGSKTTDPPLDIMPNIGDFCDKKFVKKQVNQYFSEAKLSLRNIKQSSSLYDLNDIIDAKIVCSLTGNDTATLLEMAKKNNQIYASKMSNVTNFVLRDTANWLIPTTSVINEADLLVALPLNKNQKDIIGTVFENQKDKADYVFMLCKKRGELKGRSIRYLEGKEDVLIKASSTKELKRIECDELFDRAVFESQKPELKDDGLSSTITYTWNVYPFYLPEQAKKASLYNDWEKINEKHKAFCQKLETLVNESKPQSYSEKLQRFFLGKNRILEDYTGKIEAFKSIDFSKKTLKDREEKIKEFNDLFNKITANQKEIANEIKRTAIEEEIEALNNEISILEEEYKKNEEEEKQKIAKQEEEKQEKIAAFLAKHEQKETNLPTFINDLQRRAGKKHRRKNPEDAEKAQKIVEEYKEINGTNFIAKLDDDKKRHEKRISSLQNKIKSKQKEKENLTNKSNTSQSSLDTMRKQSNKTESSKGFSIEKNVPYLPHTGELYEQGKMKYLTIDFWEDYQNGQKEAERLNAKLCTRLKK